MFYICIMYNFYQLNNNECIKYDYIVIDKTYYKNIIDINIYNDLIKLLSNEEELNINYKKDVLTSSIDEIVKVSILCILKNNYCIRITICEDDYFLVQEVNNFDYFYGFNVRKNFICDQVDGIIQLLNLYCTL